MQKPWLGALLAVAIALPCAAAPALTPEQARARAIYAKLISYKTAVGEGQVPKMTDYLVGLFRDAGFPQRRHPRAPARRDQFAGGALQG